MKDKERVCQIEYKYISKSHVHKWLQLTPEIIKFNSYHILLICFIPIHFTLFPSYSWLVQFMFWLMTSFSLLHNILEIWMRKIGPFCDSKNIMIFWNNEATDWFWENGNLLTFIKYYSTPTITLCRLNKTKGYEI